MVVWFALAVSLFLWLGGGLIIGGWITNRTNKLWLGWACALALMFGSSALVISVTGGMEAYRCHGPDPHDPCDREPSSSAVEEYP